MTVVCTWDNVGPYGSGVGGAGGEVGRYGAVGTYGSGEQSWKHGERVNSYGSSKDQW